MVAEIHEIARKPDESSIRLLREWLGQAERGELVTVMLVGQRAGGEWTTSASSSADGRADAAMLIELAMRRLGFEVTRK